jgi:hypothetical protein
MPITIKELISSDSMSGVVEKINFNFDQLILAGGGPPGIQGIPGIDGPIGPQGFRGDHWFTGPSAFGQTADHDGTSLRIKDHFLDGNGDVYEYFNITGVTGWTASGINLKGPTGPEGAAGGSLEWKIYGGTFGNAVGTTSYGPINQLAAEPNLNLNFLIPNSTFKNSIFIGDQDWAYWNLRSLGTINNTTFDLDAVPKFTVIQNNVNEFGLNGFSFGGPLLENGASGASAEYGNSGATSIGGPTYSAYNFVNAAFMTEQDTFGSGDYITKWRIHSFRSNIKIKAGGPQTGGQPNWGYRPAMFEIEANRIRIYDDSNNKGKYIGLERDVSFNYGFFLTSNDTLREIQVNSPNDINRIRNSGFSVPPGNVYGYISLQNSEGAGTNVGVSFPEHRHGTVIIGPTYNTTQSIPLATDSYQGLAIVRKITRFDNTDAAIRFFQPNIQTGDANAVLANSRTLSQSGSVTPVRIISEPAINVNGITGVVLDSLVISASNSNAGRFDISLSTGVTAYNGGRLGLTNNPIVVTKPQFPIHLYASPDFATRNFMWDGDSAKLSDRITNWYTGFDARENSQRNGGIAFGNTTWKDDLGLTDYSLGGVTISGISIYTFVVNPSPKTFTNPVLKTYVRRDSSNLTSYYGAVEAAPIGFDSVTAYGQVQGFENPHIYMQPGKEDVSGNIGIGFVPGSTAYNDLGSINIRQISYAKSKLSINGSVTIGSTHSGYHKYFNNVPVDGILIDGLIVQGETRTQGLDTLRWKGPISSEYSITYRNFTGIDDSNYRLAIGFSTEKSIMAKRFISKGDSSPMYPDFALPDAKTGMGRMIGEMNVGALYADRAYNVPTFGIGATTVSNTVPPVVVAKWSATSDGLTKNVPSRSGVGGFTVTDTFALQPAYYNINTIPVYVANWRMLEIPFAYAHQIIYHRIPSRNSTAFIDLNSPMLSFPWYTNLPIGAYSVQGPGGAYLNGRLVGSGTTLPQKPNSHQFTIENGYYDGQILRLMFLDVHPFNESVLVPNCLPQSSSPTTSDTIYSLTRTDNIVLAAEKYSSSGGASWPLVTPTGSGWNVNAFRPWPHPLNTNVPTTTITPGTPSVLSNTVIDAAITNAITQYNNQNNQFWTSASNITYEAYTSPFNGAFSDIQESSGIGAFRITPWRSITLQWKWDKEDFDGTTSGAWYEIARENLVPRKMRIYAGSGDPENSDAYYVSMLNDDLIGDSRIPASIPFTYSFYNPTGESTMQIFSGISLVKTVTNTESGILPSLTNWKVVITTPGITGNADNVIEAKCKITEFNSSNRYSSSILRNLTEFSVGPAITLDTSLPTAGNINSVFTSTYAIECSAIIKRNTL